VEYLLELANHAFPPADLRPGDVISTFAGLRPLIDRGLAARSATSREHAIWSDTRGWLHVAGGKLTTMRSMAEDAVNRAIQILRDRGFEGALRPCQTRTRPLPGAGRAGLGSGDLAPDIAAHLNETYGTRVDQVLALVTADGSLGRRLDPELPYLAAELVFAIRSDLVCEVEDALRRRVPLALFSKTNGLSVAGETADLLARERGWSEQRRTQSLDQYRAAVFASRMWQDE
jgi:glycerol-3-phosphate dehydrogenase